MDAAYQIVLVLLGFVLVGMNGFFVASEFSIVKVRRTRLQEMIGQGSHKAKMAEQLISKMDEYLSATQLGITMASLALGWIGEPAFASLFEPLFARVGAFKAVLVHSLAATSAFVLITFLHIVLGELAPKSLAIQRAEGTILWTASPLVLFYRASYPFIWALNGTANFFLRLVGVSPVEETERAHSEEELRLLLAQSQEKGILDRDEKRMLERVFDFAERSVRQVMVPSLEVVYLDVQKPLEENLKIARTKRHTRYPLCDGSRDRVLGIIHVKDLFWNLPSIGEDFDLRILKRPVQFVPDSKLIKSLLTEFRNTRTHLAVVVDEYGGTVGIVALEDILEELVGEIEDEFDVEVAPPRVQRIDETHWLVQGRALLEEVEAALGVEIEDEENDTVAGHIMMLLGRTARIGDEVTVASRFKVRVIGMKGFQITDLSFKTLNVGEEGEGVKTP